MTVEHLSTGQKKKQQVVSVKKLLLEKLDAITEGLEAISSGEGALVSYSDVAFKSIVVGDTVELDGYNYKVINLCSSDGENSISMDVAFSLGSSNKDYFIRYSEDNEATWTEYEHIS